MPIKIGKLTLGNQPTVCAVLQDRFTTETLKQLKSAKIQLVELRVDQFHKLDFPSIQSKIHTLKKNGFAILLTVRDRREGGSGKLSSKERLNIFRSFAKSVDLLDIELHSDICKSVVQLAKKNHKKIIVSFHDFKKTISSELLENLFRRAQKLKADIFKVACFSKTNQDVARLMLFTVNHAHDQVIVIAMGNAGKESRILFPRCGSIISYGFAGRKSAPGQFSALQLANYFRRS